MDEEYNEIMLLKYIAKDSNQALEKLHKCASLCGEAGTVNSVSIINISQVIWLIFMFIK